MNVEKFGANGNDLKDDTQAFLTAFKKIKNGGTIYLKDNQ